jgi:Holliday junction resolvase RusA-like endonuclease
LSQPPVNLLRVFIPGIPRPGGSKTARVIERNGEIVRHNGRPLVTMRDDAKGNADWKQTVAFTARKFWRGQPARIPLRLSVTFRMPRLKGHYGSGRNAGELKPSAPRYHTVKPDSTKLMRALEDALTGIVWADDALIAEQYATKVYGETPGAMVEVFALDTAQDTPAPRDGRLSTGPSCSHQEKPGAPDGEARREVATLFAAGGVR